MISLLIRFLLGGLIYMGIEVAFDNTSDRTMGLVGGVSFVLCGYYDEWFHFPYILECLFIASTIVIFEYIAGRIWNKDYQIWDYRKMPFNLHGQICLTFFIVWVILIAPVIIILDNLFKLIF